MAKLNSQAQKFIDNCWSGQRPSKVKDTASKIHVDEVASRVEKFYEKFREVVDWREKHLMRRIAIERVLKRRMFLKIHTDSIAEPLVLELIRGGHFPNDTIEVAKIEAIQQILNKYNFILAHSPAPIKNKNRSQLYTYILGIAACEIEEALDPASYQQTQALTEYMEAIMRERIKIGKRAREKFGEISEREFGTQINIAVQQALFKLDAPIINYNLIKRWFPEWLKLSRIKLSEIANDIYFIWEAIEKKFAHPLADKFYNVCGQHSTPFVLIGDIVNSEENQLEEKFADPISLEALAKKAYIKRFKSLKLRLVRAAVYSTMSIFLTKMLFLYLIEVPLTKFFSGQVNTLAMILDILGPTLLMFVLVITIRPPKKGNFKRVLSALKKDVFELSKKEVYEIEVYGRRGFFLRILVGLLYFLDFVICFGVIIFVLYKLQYPPISCLILIVFTSLIAFTGTQIRQRSRELHMTPDKDTIIHVIVDPLSLPVIHLGRWLSERWKKYNIITVFLNLLIDTPFLIFVEFLEQWRYFLKEKKEEIH